MRAKLLFAVFLYLVVLAQLKHSFGFNVVKDNSGWSVNNYCYHPPKYRSGLEYSLDSWYLNKNTVYQELGQKYGQLVIETIDEFNQSSYLPVIKTKPDKNTDKTFKFQWENLEDGIVGRARHNTLFVMDCRISFAPLTKKYGRFKMQVLIMHEILHCYGYKHHPDQFNLLYSSVPDVFSEHHLHSMFKEYADDMNHAKLFGYPKKINLHECAL